MVSVPVRVLPFLMPMFGKGGLVHPKLVKALNSALWMYDLTGGARIGKLHERIAADEVMGHMPTLRRDRVVGGFIYYDRSEEHTSELQSRQYLVCRLLLEKKKKKERK